MNDVDGVLSSKLEKGNVSEDYDTARKIEQKISENISAIVLANTKINTNITKLELMGIDVDGLKNDIKDIEQQLEEKYNDLVDLVMAKKVELEIKIDGNTASINDTQTEITDLETEINGRLDDKQDSIDNNHNRINALEQSQQNIHIQDLVNVTNDLLANAHNGQVLTCDSNSGKFILTDKTGGEQGGVADAPADGEIYGRMNNAWHSIGRKGTVDMTPPTGSIYTVREIRELSDHTLYRADFGNDNKGYFNLPSEYSDDVKVFVYKYSNEETKLYIAVTDTKGDEYLDTLFLDIEENALPETEINSTNETRYTVEYSKAYAKKLVDTLRVTVNANSNKSSTNATNIKNNSDKLTENSAKLNENTADISTNTASISTLKGKTTNLETDLIIKQTEIDNNKTKIGDIERVNTNQNTEIATLTQNVTNLDTKVEGFNGRITKIEDNYLTKLGYEDNPLVALFDPRTQRVHGNWQMDNQRIVDGNIIKSDGNGLDGVIAEDGSLYVGKGYTNAIYDNPRDTDKRLTNGFEDNKFKLEAKENNVYKLTFKEDFDPNIYANENWGKYSLALNGKKSYIFLDGDKYVYAKVIKQTGLDDFRFSFKSGDSGVATIDLDSNDIIDFYGKISNFPSLWIIPKDTNDVKIITAGSFLEIKAFVSEDIEQRVPPIKDKFDGGRLVLEEPWTSVDHSFIGKTTPTYSTQNNHYGRLYNCTSPDKKTNVERIETPLSERDKIEFNDIIEWSISNSYKKYTNKTQNYSGYPDPHFLGTTDGYVTLSPNLKTNSNGFVNMNNLHYIAIYKGDLTQEQLEEQNSILENGNYGLESGWTKGWNKMTGESEVLTIDIETISMDFNEVIPTKGNCQTAFELTKDHDYEKDKRFFIRTMTNTRLFLIDYRGKAGGSASDTGDFFIMPTHLATNS